MFIRRGKRAKQEQNSLIRIVDHLLARNFFRIEDFTSMRRRRAIKTLKLIAKAEKRHVKRTEIIELYEFIMQGLPVTKTSSVVTRFFGLFNIKVRMTTTMQRFAFDLVDMFYFVFRLLMRPILRV